MDQVKIDNVMYQFQHKMLPEWFYNDPKEFIGVVCSDKTALFTILSELFRRAETDNPYGAGQFAVEPGMVNENIAVIRIKFPKPINAPLCHSALCFFDKGFKNLKYYTFEVGEDIEGGFPVLCTWTEDGEHLSLGSVSPDPDEQLAQCVEMFMGRYGEEIDAAYNH